MKETHRQKTRQVSQPLQASTSLKNGMLLTGRILLLLLLCIHMFNVEYRPITGGLDPSWQYIINYGFDRRIEFNVTSGPLGFINYPLNIGANLDISVIIRVVWWLALCLWFGVLFLGKRFSLRNVGVFTALFVLGSNMTFDYVVCFTILLLLSFALFSERWLWWYPIVLALSALLGLIKLSALLLTVASCLMFTVIAFLLDHRKGLLAGVLTGTGIPLLFCLFYLLYDPSFSRMAAYIKRGLDISSNYSIAMSVSGRPLALWLAFAILLAYLLQLAWLWRCRQKSGWLALMYLPAVFFAFKHGFVRQDGHEITFFTVLSLVLGLLWLFTSINRSTGWAFICLMPILLTRLAIPGYSVDLSEMMGISKMVVMSELLDYQKTKQRLDAYTSKFLQQYALPSEWRQMIGSATVSIFPWETAYAPANNLNYRPFPIIQTYTTYTAYLDSVNADFLTDPQTAPEYVLMEWVAIDYRHALLDVPAMWLALYQWYDVERELYTPFPLSLLKRREYPRFDELEFLERREYRAGDYIEVPDSDQPVIIKLSMELSLLGNLTKIFFRIPEVTMEIVGTSGYHVYRIVPETLSNPLCINALPISLHDVFLLTNHDQIRGRVYGITLSGKGLPLYKKTLYTEFYTIPEIRLSQIVSPDWGQLTKRPEIPLFEVERISRYTPKTSSPYAGQPDTFLLIEGWAVDAHAQKRAGSVYLEIDGQLYATYSGFSRDDIAARFQNPAYGSSGFQAGIPLAVLDKGHHRLVVKILSHDRQSYFSSAGEVTFEIH